MTKNNPQTTRYLKGSKLVFILFVFIFIVASYKDIRKGFAEGFGSLKNTAKANLQSSINKQEEAFDFNQFFILSGIY